MSHKNAILAVQIITFRRMKRLFAIVIMAFPLLFACTPEEKNNGDSQNNYDDLVVTGDALEITEYSVKLTGFANLPLDLGNAEVGIMYDKQQSFEGAKKLLAAGLDGNNKFTVTVTGLEPSTTYYYKSYVQNGMAVKYGAVKSFTTSFFPVESVSLDKTEYTFNTIGNTLTLTATVLPADATDKSVSWTSDKEAIATVDAYGRVNAKGNGTATITVTTKDQGKSATCVITVSQWVTSISLDKTSITLNEGQEQTLTPTVNPSNAADKSLNWTSNNTSVATVNAEGKVTAVSKGTATIKAEAKDGSGVFASCSVRVKEPYTAVAGEAVDLGLSVKWSSTNLGATSPTGYGDYFSWGEVEPYYSSQDPLTWKEGKTGYNWASYKWCNGAYNKFTKYCPADRASYWDGNGSPDGKTVLDPEDDAAHVNLGGKWRMPTDAEFTELREKCKWTWTTQNGVNGRLVTGKNGNSIFLPTAGYRVGTDFYNAGSYGYYLSSSLNTNNPNDAWFVYFYSDNVDWNYSYYRYFGRSVRPVTE